MRTCFPKCLDVFRPFRPEDIRTSQRAVSTAYDQCVDALLDEIICGRLPAFLCLEGHGSGSADEGSTLSRMITL